MARLVTIQRASAKKPSLWHRARMAARAYWTGPFKVNESSDAAIARSVFSDGYGSAAGIPVTPELAFTCSAFYDGVNQISSDVAKMPLNLMKRVEGGGSVPYVESKLFRLLKHQPNPEMGSMVFRRQLTSWALISHGGFAEIQRDQVGRAVALWPIEPHRVSIERETLPNGRLGALQYVVDGTAVVPAADMIHIQGLGYCPHEPYGLIAKARQAIGLALAAERFGASFFGNGSTFGGLLTSDGPMPDEEELKKLRELIESAHRGPDKAHRLAFLFGGFKYQQMGVNPKDSEMNELRDKQVEEVARFLRIPPARLGLTKPGTMSYASVEMANLEYYTGCLLDWITLWEDELNRKLIPALEYRHQYVKHNADVFLRADIKNRYEALGIARDKGIITANEWRALDDLPPLPGGQGDLVLVQSAQYPLHLIGTKAEAEIDKIKTPPPTQVEVNDANERAAQAEQAMREAEAARSDAEKQRDQARAEVQLAHELLNAAETRLDEVQCPVCKNTGGTADGPCSACAVGACALASRQALAQLETVKAEAAAELDAMRAAVASAEVTAQEAAARATASDEDRAQATQAAAAALAELEAREQAVQAAQQAVAEAEARVASTEEALAAALATAQSETAAAQSELEAARALLAETGERVTALEADAQSAAERAASAERERDEALLARAESEQRLAEAEAARAEAVLAEARAREAAEASERSIEAANAAVDAAQREAEQRVDAMLSQAKGRDAALFAACRSVLEDALGVLVRREVAQARQRQSTQPKLRAWLAGYRVTHEPVCLERLTTPVRLHLTLMGRTDDPSVVAAGLVTRHLEAFEARIQKALEVSPEDFHVVLERTLERWEREHPAAIADQWLVEGIRHVA